MIHGVCLIDDVVYQDERGFFLESYNQRRLQAHLTDTRLRTEVEQFTGTNLRTEIEQFTDTGSRTEINQLTDINFVQDNLSVSKLGVLRGLHYQYQHPQAKLVRVLQGEIWDVVVDLRQSSPSFGQWAAYSLSAERAQQLFIPIGCAHGFLSLSDSALVMYKVSDYYYPEDEYCLRYDDPHVKIEWPLAQLKRAVSARSEPITSPILSTKDAQGLAWKELPLFD